MDLKDFIGLLISGSIFWGMWAYMMGQVINDILRFRNSDEEDSE